MARLLPPIGPGQSNELDPIAPAQLECSISTVDAKRCLPRKTGIFPGGIARRCVIFTHCACFPRMNYGLAFCRRKTNSTLSSCFFNCS